MEESEIESEAETPEQPKKSGFVAIIGRPNAGKSTLLNGLLGEKLAAVTPKPQTTRDKILGVVHLPEGQIAFVDTPGFHKARHELNRWMVREALSTLDDVNAVVLVVDAHSGFHEEDKMLLEELEKSKLPIVLALNKVDKFRDKKKLLPVIDSWVERFSFHAIVPISAKREDGLELIIKEILPLLPEGGPILPDDEFTDRPAKFLVAEMIREQVFLQTNQEIPYSCAVTIDKYQEPTTTKNTAHIAATIHVERDSQKAIVIGKGGLMLKQIGTAARGQAETLLRQKVFLELFVRVEENWSENSKSMKKLGYK
jgi:GTP-binding protein Era